MIRRLLAAAVTTALAGAACDRTTPPAADDVRRLRDENVALRERNAELAAKLGVPAEPAVASRPAAPSGDPAVGMTVAQVRAIAERDGLRFARFESPVKPDPAGEETWRLAKVTEVFVPPPGSIERRYNFGSERAQVRERVEWAKTVRTKAGVVTGIDPARD
jgi:hypothetical protein